MMPDTTWKPPVNAKPFTPTRTAKEFAVHRASLLKALADVWFRRVWEACSEDADDAIFHGMLLAMKDEFRAAAQEEHHFVTPSRESDWGYWCGYHGNGVPISPLR